MSQASLGQLKTPGTQSARGSTCSQHRRNTSCLRNFLRFDTCSHSNQLRQIGVARYVTIFQRLKGEGLPSSTSVPVKQDVPQDFGLFPGTEAQ